MDSENIKKLKELIKSKEEYRQVASYLASKINTEVSNSMTLANTLKITEPLVVPFLKELEKLEFGKCEKMGSRKNSVRIKWYYQTAELFSSFKLILIYNKNTTHLRERKKVSKSPTSSKSRGKNKKPLASESVAFLSIENKELKTKISMEFPLSLKKEALRGELEVFLRNHF